MASFTVVSSVLSMFCVAPSFFLGLLEVGDSAKPVVLVLPYLPVPFVLLNSDSVFTLVLAGF